MLLCYIEFLFHFFFCPVIIEFMIGDLFGFRYELNVIHMLKILNQYCEFRIRNIWHHVSSDCIMISKLLIRYRLTEGLIRSQSVV